MKTKKLFTWQWLFTTGVCLFLIPVLLLTIPGVTGSEEARTDLNVRSFTVRTSDFDEMVEQRLIRVLVVYSKTFYFIDGAQQRGISYDELMEFEKLINKQLTLKTRQVQMVFIPVQRDELLPSDSLVRQSILFTNTSANKAVRRYGYFHRRYDERTNPNMFFDNCSLCIDLFSRFHNLRAIDGGSDAGAGTGGDPDSAGENDDCDAQGHYSVYRSGRGRTSGSPRRV